MPGALGGQFGLDPGDLALGLGPRTPGHLRHPLVQLVHPVRRILPFPQQVGQLGRTGRDPPRGLGKGLARPAGLRGLGDQEHPVTHLGPRRRLRLDRPGDLDTVKCPGGQGEGEDAENEQETRHLGSGQLVSRVKTSARGPPFATVTVKVPSASGRNGQ